MRDRPQPAAGGIRPPVPRRSLAVAWCAFAGLLAVQAFLSRQAPENWQLEASAGTPPSAIAARLATLDESALASYASALYIQGFDAQAGALLPLRTADYPSIRAWLGLSLELDPHSSYPLLLAAFDYTETAHLEDELFHPMIPEAPKMLEFVERGFQADPAAHWRALAHAAWAARFSLHDDQRALREAQMLRDAPPAAGVPRWARELDSFVLQRDDPVEASRALLGGLAGGSQDTDAREIERLAGRIESMASGKPRKRDAIDRLIPNFSSDKQPHNP